MSRTAEILKSSATALGLCGLFAGLYVLSSTPPSLPEKHPKAKITEGDPVDIREAEELVAGLLPLAEDMRQALTTAQMEKEALQHQLDDVLNWILENFQGSLPLKENALSYLNIPPMDENFGLHPALAEFLHVSTDEQFLMEDAFDFTRGNLRVLQDQNLSITSPTPAQVMMTIGEFPEEGLALREDLYSALEATLGTDRLDQLLTMSQEELNAGFDFFGQASRTLMFEIILDETDNELKVVVNDGWFNQQNPDQVVYSESESVVSKLPFQYADFQYLLPESFAPFMNVQ